MTVRQRLTGAEGGVESPKCRTKALRDEFQEYVPRALPIGAGLSTPASPPLKANVTIGLVLCAALGASPPPKPLPWTAPESVAPRGVRVHVKASDELDVDTLRRFARPGVTLWLSTRTNVLRASTVENLNRFDATFVALRPPITEAQSQALEKAPRAGVWLDAKSMEGKGLSRMIGPRPLAIRLEGDLDEALAARITALKPVRVDWTAPATLDVLAWSLFRALPGKKLLSVEAAATACEASSDREPASRVHVAALLSLGAPAFPCGPGPRVVIAPDTDRWLIQSILVRDPTAELELEIGADELSAKKAGKLLDDLDLGPGR